MCSCTGDDSLSILHLAIYRLANFSVSKGSKLPLHNTDFTSRREGTVFQLLVGNIKQNASLYSD